VTRGIAACLGSIEDNIQINVGSCLPHMWGFRVGRIENPAREIWRFFWIPYWVVLDQANLNRPFHSPPTVIDVEFAVNALGVSPNRAQSDDEFLGDLGTRQLSFEQA
jgi:hypothetical protein